MKISVVSTKELGPSEVARWSEIQDCNPTLASPYFCPQFSQAVGRTCEQAQVGIIEEAGNIVGFFPYQLHGRRIGKPPGWPMCDYQGIISPAEQSWDAAELLGACGLDIYDFDHMLTSQTTFARFCVSTMEAPYLDLAQGYEHYVAERARDGTRVIKKNIASAWRKMDREEGPIRFVLHDDSDAAFEALINWKSDQYLRTNAVNLFAYDWPLRLLREIRGMQDPAFAGVLSSLYAGDKVVAVSLGMRSRSMWHYWFPAYSVEYQKYSPGFRLLIEMAKNAAALGVKIIDLGRGMEDYKRRLASASTLVGQGFAGQPSLAMARRMLWRALGSCVNRLPAAAPWNIPARAYRRIEARSVRP